MITWILFAIILFVYWLALPNASSPCDYYESPELREAQKEFNATRFI